TILPFLFHATPTTESYTLSLHDALPIFLEDHLALRVDLLGVEQEVLHAVRVKLEHEVELVRDDVDEVRGDVLGGERVVLAAVLRSEEHTSELQSRGHLVCRLLLEKKNNE